ncbi:MAG: FtsX-like permease family protein [Chloroflexaceae bacterium]|nr:FtsX-like permease family protein [Chloroflexaceae bacterium]
MFSPRWSKVLRDIWGYKTRTLLVVLSIAAGVFAFGTIITSRENVLKNLQTQFLASNPASATISVGTDDLFDTVLLENLRRVDGVGAAEGIRRVQARIQIAPNVWEDIELHVLPDDGIRSVNMVQPYAGVFPPPNNALVIERAALSKTGAQLGDSVQISLAGGKTRTMPIVGLAHDLTLPPAPVAGKAFGYINAPTLEWLGLERGYNEVIISVAEEPRNTDHIWEVAEQTAQRIERSGRTVTATDVPPPLQHPAEDILQTILLILAGLGLLSLVLSSFLIINTTSAILSQQVRQIGMMKAIGATTAQISWLYVGLLLLLSVLALCVALPLAALGARGFTAFLANQLNFDVQDFRMPLWAVLLQAAAAILIPVLTGLPIILSSARITVRQALDNNIGTPSQSRLDRLIEGVRGLSRPTTLALRNTFRRKGRLIRTITALTIAGAIAIGVLSVRTSLDQTLDDAMATRKYDIEVQLGRSYRAAAIEPLAMQVDGVDYAEGWGLTRAIPTRSDGSEGEAVTVYAPPAGTALFVPNIEQGRWLLPDDEYALVVSSNFLLKEPDAQLGASVRLSIDGVERDWQIVGISRETSPPANPARAYLNYATFTRIAGQVGHVNSLHIVTTSRDPTQHAQVAQALEAHFDQQNISVRLIRTSTYERTILTERFNILTIVLTTMALLIGMVGALGLMGTMSMNVMERNREIGIMRAVGASDGIVQQIVLTEGVLIGLLAWLSGTLLSLPFSRVMAMQIGYALLNQPLSYAYAVWALLLWFIIVLLLAMLASAVPARNASRMTIREVLTHE